MHRGNSQLNVGVPFPIEKATSKPGCSDNETFWYQTNPLDSPDQVRCKALCELTQTFSHMAEGNGRLWEDSG